MTRGRKVAAGVLGTAVAAQVSMWGLGIARGSDNITVPDGWAPGLAVTVPAIVNTEPITARSARYLPPCREEDGPSPCRWDAARMGNGVGHSFYLDRDACIHYTRAADAARWDDWGHGPCADPYATATP